MAFSRIIAHVRVRDASVQAENRAFYGDVLGLDPLPLAHGDRLLAYAPGDPASGTVFLLTRDIIDADHVPDLIVEVDDIDTVYAATMRAGHDILYPLRTEPWGVRRFFVRDPNAAVVNVLSRSAPA